MGSYGFTMPQTTIGGVLTGIAGSVLGQIISGQIQGATGRVPATRNPAEAIPSYPTPDTSPVLVMAPNLTYGVTAYGRGGGYRRMNPCNPKALKRAIRRVDSFARFAKKSVKIMTKVKKPRRRCR